MIQTGSDDDGDEKGGSLYRGYDRQRRSEAGRKVNAIQTSAGILAKSETTSTFETRRAVASSVDARTFFENFQNFQEGRFLLQQVRP